MKRTSCSRYCISVQLDHSNTLCYGLGSGRVWVAEGAREKSGSEELRSGQEAEGLGFNLCIAPSCTQVSYFGKADRTEKETGGTEVNIQTGDTGGNI